MFNGQTKGTAAGPFRAGFSADTEAVNKWVPYYSFAQAAETKLPQDVVYRNLVKAQLNDPSWKLNAQQTH